MAFKQPVSTPTLEKLQRQLQEAIKESDRSMGYLLNNPYECSCGAAENHHANEAQVGLFMEQRIARLKQEIAALLAEQRLACDAELSMFDDGELPSPI